MIIGAVAGEAPSGTEARKAATFRLKHDLGKYVRWNAPSSPETDDATLRERLALDLLATRKTEDETLTAVELFDRWLAEEGDLVEGPRFAPDLAALREAIDVMRALLPRLALLGRPDLDRLDAASRTVAERTLALHRLP